MKHQHQPVLADGSLRDVLLLSCGLGVAALLADLQPMLLMEFTGRNPVLVAQQTASALLSGAVWGLLPVVVGRLLRRPWQAAVWGIGSLEAALVSHYGLGAVIGQFTAGEVVSNAVWFIAALVVGAPLGLLGLLTRAPGLLGLVSGLVAAAGVFYHPFWAGWFSSEAVGREGVLLAHQIVSVMEVAAGTALAVGVLVAHVRGRSSTRGAAAVREGPVAVETEAPRG